MMEITDKEFDETIRLAIDTYGKEPQTRMLFEEMAELQDAICKFARKRDTADHVCEEIADVMIMCLQMAQIYGSEDVERWADKKIRRLAERLKGGNGIESGGQGRDKADMRPYRGFKEGDSVRITTCQDLTGTVTACNVPGRIYTVDTINGTMVCKRRDLVLLNQINNRNMKELNLCEIIKGHEEDVFYSPMWGDTNAFIYPGNAAIRITMANVPKMSLNIHPSGKYEDKGECLLFPSRDQRDWNKWAEENREMTYEDVCKELFKNNYFFISSVGTIAYTNSYYPDRMSSSAVSKNQLKKLIAINKLMNVQKWIEKGWQPDWSEGKYKYFFEIDNRSNTLKIDANTTFNSRFAYFSSEENARKAIEILGEDVIRLALSTDW